MIPLFLMPSIRQGVIENEFKFQRIIHAYSTGHIQPQPPIHNIQCGFGQTQIPFFMHSFISVASLKVKIFFKYLHNKTKKNFFCMIVCLSDYCKSIYILYTVYFCVCVYKQAYIVTMHRA